MSYLPAAEADQEVLGFIDKPLVARFTGVRLIFEEKDSGDAQVRAEVIFKPAAAVLGPRQEGVILFALRV